MALIKCKDCGSQISDQAKDCPQCGKPVKESFGCLNIFIISLLVIIFASAIISSLRGKDEKDEKDYCFGKELLAYSYAEKHVKNKLKSPSSAIFPSAREKKDHTKANSSECSYTITSWVESQNSFGAMIKQEFECVISFEGDKVRCSKLIFH